MIEARSFERLCVIVTVQLPGSLLRLIVNAHRRTHDIAAPNNDAMLPSGLYPKMLQENKDPRRRCGQVTWQPQYHAPQILGMKAIDILARVDRQGHLLFVYVLGQG